MQVTKGTWRIREQCVPGSLSSSPIQEPGNEANTVVARHHASVAPSHHLYCSFHASILYGGKSTKFRGNAYRLFLQFLFLQNECMTL